MGNCFSDDAVGRSAAGATPFSQNNTSNTAVDCFLLSRGYRGLYSQIELSFSASNLRDRDVFSQSDPMVVIYTKGRDGKLEELDRTEVIQNSLNPKWIHKLKITYLFEVVQTLVFFVYDVDTQYQNLGVKMLKLDEQQYLGEATCVLSEIVTKSERSLTLDLVYREESTSSTHTHHRGKFTVHAEECVSSKTTTEMILSPLIIECYNFNNNGKHELIGKVQKSLVELEKLSFSGEGENLFLLPSAGHDYHIKVLKSQLFVDKFSESVQQTFLDYIAGGYEMNFMVAVDFTASNGNPRLPDSLHFIDPSGRPNSYQRAIIEVGEVLQFYDSDKRFPAWGFGARPIDGPVSHCFNLNGSSHYCEVEGTQGILMAYTSALHNVSLAGPTLFGPVVNNAALIASQSLASGGRKYFVLLIITDGVVTDLQETKDALVKASDLPLSILIVGVGGADFKEMEVLDADKGERLESTTGRVASRDIVQFVPFRDVQGGGISVVQELLAEIPHQFLTYIRSRDVQPNS
ncbi:protein BONZAI 2-like isoform X2 [Cucurbita moschata]|uniref:Protein BONZAI 2-like isoform X2 n=1 Tax=Cucurbita moschata TaxID=3662 RepID=A0A6J1E2Y2_CUCMO|nr:protein BONZAI 2-like isoform X2 [Cucurbita moschata]